MERAKQAAKDFISGDGKHKTTVDQDSRAAVTQEQVNPHHHEDITTAVDREVHQDHHQTRVQPILHKETLPEKHTHKVLPVEHKTVHHGNSKDDAQRLEQEAAQYRDTSTTNRTTHSQNVAPTVAGERIHHHVHEHIQPVIQKETIAPTTEHVTVPVHETHHKAAVHHDTTTLPPKTLEEFSGRGGLENIKPRGTQTLQEYEGCPKPLKEGVDSQRAIHGENLTGRSGVGSENMMGSGYEGQSHAGHSHVGSGIGHSGGAGAAGIAANAATHEHGKQRNTLGGATGNMTHSSEDYRDQRAGGHTGAEHHKKPSLMDKLNPKTDADLDGKKGILD